MKMKILLILVFGNDNGNENPEAKAQWKIYSGTATGNLWKIHPYTIEKKIMWMTEGIAEFCNLGLLLC